MSKEGSPLAVLANTRLLIQQLKDRQRIHPQAMHYLIQKASILIRNEPNLLRLTSPITIVGDIHGQFYDLLNMLQLFGGVGPKQWLFLGDFIDRGSFSIEVITLLLALKVRHPQRIHLLRGNHESRSMTAAFNFRQECLTKYDQITYDALMRLFDELPLCAVIDQKYFAVHAGISPSCQTLQEIQQLNRFSEVPSSGGVCDLLWSDPSASTSTLWEQNSQRNCSYYFGTRQATAFLDRNRLAMIIRGHQVQLDGYTYQTSLGAPLTLTIFSAPNYANCNRGAIAQITPQGLQVRTFTEVQHPFCLPGFQNLFEWSLPCIANCADHLFRQLLRLAPINDPKLQAILNSQEAFQEDYFSKRTAMLVDQVLRMHDKPTEVAETFPSASSPKGSRTKHARVIGPKLKKSAKIGSLRPSDDEKEPF